MSEPDVSQMVRELTEPYKHTERRDMPGGHFAVHRSWHPSLLSQLRFAALSTVGDDAGSGVAESKPPMTLGPLDTLQRIQAAAADWVSRGLQLKLRDSVEGNIRLLGSRASTAGDDLAREIERWWRWARVESQWDGRPRALRDRCPHCGERTLRLAWDLAAAWCASCGVTWDKAELGLLAGMLGTEVA